MSLSCKGKDHSEIEMEFQKELNALSNEGENVLPWRSQAHNQGKDGETSSLC